MNSETKNINNIDELDARTASVISEQIDNNSKKMTVVLETQSSRESISIEQISDNEFGDIEFVETTKDGGKKKTVISASENREVYNRVFAMIESLIDK